MLSASVSLDLKALYKSVIIIIIIKWGQMLEADVEAKTWGQSFGQTEQCINRIFNLVI